MLQIRNLSKQFKPGKPVFSDITRTFRPGSAVGLMGPNGSGKTTFLRILSVNSFPTEGEVNWNGSDIHSNPSAYLKDVGLVHDEESLPRHLTAVELLEWIAKSRKIWNDETRAKSDRIFDQLSLVERDDLIGTYSTGMKKKTQIAAALIVEPKVLIMDEPLRGLDISTREAVTILIEGAKKNNTLILMASHAIPADNLIFDEMIQFPL